MMLLQVTFPVFPLSPSAALHLVICPPCIPHITLHCDNCHRLCHRQRCLQEMCHKQMALLLPKTHSKKQAQLQHLLAKKPLVWTQVLARPPLPFVVIAGLHLPLTMPVPLLGRSKETQAPVLKMLMPYQSSSSFNGAVQAPL